MRWMISGLMAWSMAMLWPMAAQAAMMEASSAHFVIYADDSETDIRRFAEQLERYHKAMSVITGWEIDPPSPSNRVTIYVVRNDREVRRLFGEGGRQVGAFYVPRAGGSFAVVPRLRQGRGEMDYSMIALLHEYAHHFLISNGGFPLPTWLGEGSAEFFASAEFTSDGGLSVGRPAVHRAGELFLAADVKAAELLDPESFQRRLRTGLESYYGKSWLLYHYLAFSDQRRGQLRQYIAEMVAGRSSLQAGEIAFGDLGQLERDLDGYLRQRRMSTFEFKPEGLSIGPINVRQLRAGEAEVLPLVTRSRRGVNREQALALLPEVRAVAERHPEEPSVFAALAEAEYDAGNNAEAIAAADHALARDPANVNAHVQKGYALFRMASEAADQTTAYTEAMKPFLALNRLENDHPLPLIYNFRSYVESGRQLPPVAVQGLERAAELAPFDLSLRMNVAMQQIQEKRFDQARGNLVPVAYNPHGGDFATSVRAVVERLAAGDELDSRDVDLLMRAPRPAALDIEGEE